MAIDARIRGDLEKVLLSDPPDSRARPRSGETVRYHPIQQRPQMRATQLGRDNAFLARARYERILPPG